MTSAKARISRNITSSKRQPRYHGHLGSKVGYAVSRNCPARGRRTTLPCAAMRGNRRARRHLAHGAGSMPQRRASDSISTDGCGYMSMGAPRTRSPTWRARWPEPGQGCSTASLAARRLTTRSTADCPPSSTPDPSLEEYDSRTLVPLGRCALAALECWHSDLTRNENPA